MKKFVILIFLIVSTTLVAQEFGSNALYLNRDMDSTDLNQPDLVRKKGFTPDVSVTLGSSFSSWGPGVTTFGSWVMPEFTFPVSNKFAVRAGIGYANIFYSTPGNEGNIFQQNNGQFGHLYVSGIYRVTEKFTIAGTAFKTFEIATPQNQINPRALDFSNEGIILNMDYQINDNMRINATFSYQRYNSYGNFLNPGGFYGQPTPFGQPSPFFNPAFGPAF